MKHRAGWAGFWAATILACCLSDTATAQEEGPADYKAMYAAAEYEKALALLAPLDTPDAHQYKALCLLALGRTDEARAVIKDIVTASPTLVPSADEVPPRYVELVDDTRKSLLPAIARQAFAEGRELFAAKQAKEAADKFALVLTLVADPAFEDTASAQDLKTLAQGFVDLTRASMPPPPTAQAAPRPAPSQPPPPVRAPSPTVMQAVAIERRVPAVPREIVGRVAPTLSLLVQIDVNGRVTNAAIRQSAHPMYDSLVIRATREWRYTPATLNGVPIPSEQLVTIQAGPE